MKKRKVILSLSLFIFALVLSIASVDAGAGIPATRVSSSKITETSTIGYSFCGRTNGSFKGTATTYKYIIKINDQPYESFCIDPGNSTPATIMQCSLLSDQGLTFLFEQRKNGVSDAVFNVALRLYALSENLIIKLGQDASGKLSNNYSKSAFIQFEQIDSNPSADFSANCGSNYSTNKWDYLYEVGNQGKEPTGILKQAYELYQQAITYPGYGETSSSTLANGVKFTEKVYKSGTAEHYIVSDQAIDKSLLGEPECENCTIVNFEWSGTSGVITVAAECNQDYKVGISSMEKGVYACNDSAKSTQTLLMLAEENSSDGDTSAKLWDEGKIPCDGADCCTTGTAIEPGYIEGSVNNCCEDGGNSEAHEYNLDDLFCKDEDLQVDYYFPKCKTDYYIQEDTALNEKYCQMYCTERVSVEIPGSITAVSGRYFELTTTSKGTKSPYIEGFKRCRVRVQYDIWESDYYNVVKKEISSYNDFQYNEAYKKMYEDAINKGKVSGQTETSTISCSASCSFTYTSTCDGVTCEKTENLSKSKSENCTISYNRYNFNWMYNYYYVKLDETKRNAYSEYEIIKGTSGTTSHRAWSSFEIDTSISACNSRVTAMETSVTLSSSNGKCTAKYSCGRTATTAEAMREDVHTAKSKFEGYASTANTSYNNAASEAKQLEEDIDRCDNYFTKYEGANAEENYDFDASMQFSYTQVYMDNDKGLQLDEQYISFEETPGCVITGPTAGPDSADALAGKRYSSVYSKSGNTETLQDFAQKQLQYVDSADGYKAYRDTVYVADKVFTHDAKYHAECSWDEGENVYFTLSPNGAASENTDVINFTEHGQEYRLYLATLDGTYETYWKVQGLGSRVKGTAKGKFDDFFKEQGSTCADESPSETSMFTCKLHVEYEIVLTGYCNGSNGTDTTVSTADCDPYKEGYNLFSFKVVDPSNLFPNGYTTDAGDVGYNWSSTDLGQQVKNEIETRGQADRTYSPDYLTYSFILSPTDMGHIKNYNAEANTEGGYSDFKMDCDCSGTSCVNCKSRFLNELANGNVTYDGQSHSVTGWANSSITLDGVRRKYGW